jgi:mannose-6-phosphate isomerase-like protein (cupin superfamily)
MDIINFNKETEGEAQSVKKCGKEECNGKNSKHLEEKWYDENNRSEKELNQNFPLSHGKQMLLQPCDLQSHDVWDTEEYWSIEEGDVIIDKGEKSESIEEGDVIIDKGGKSESIEKGDVVEKDESESNGRGESSDVLHQSAPYISKEVHCPVAKEITRRLCNAGKHRPYHDSCREEITRGLCNAGKHSPHHDSCIARSMIKNLCKAVKHSPPLQYIYDPIHQLSPHSPAMESPQNLMTEIQSLLNSIALPTGPLNQPPALFYPSPPSSPPPLSLPPPLVLSPEPSVTFAGEFFTEKVVYCGGGECYGRGYHDFVALDTDFNVGEMNGDPLQIYGKSA